jgi:hypothetical protein
MSRCRCYEGDVDDETCIHDCEHDDEMADDVDELDFEEEADTMPDGVDDWLREDPA